MTAAVASLLRPPIWRMHRQMRKTLIATTRVLPNLLFVIAFFAAVLLMFMIASASKIAQRQKELYVAAKSVAFGYASQTRAWLKNATTRLNRPLIDFDKAELFF